MHEQHSSHVALEVIVVAVVQLATLPVKAVLQAKTAADEAAL